MSRAGTRRTSIVATLAVALLGLRQVAHGSSENLLVPMTACVYRQSTTNAYGGPTAVRFSGVGVLASGTLSDAFYYLSPDDPTVALGPNGGALHWSRASEGGCTCTTECPSQNHLIASTLVGATPAFNPAHEYDVVVDFGTDPPEPIRFGPSDCVCGDQSGAIRVSFACATDDDCGDSLGCTVGTCEPSRQCSHRYDAHRCGVSFDAIVSGALAGDGRLYIAGSLGGQLALARFLPDGSPDETFGRGGEIVDELASGTAGIVVESNARVLALDDGTNRDRTQLLVRYNSDGSRDDVFGFRGCARRVAKGQLLAVGSRVLQVGNALTPEGDSDGLIIVAYRADGSVDRSYGNLGILRTGLPFSTDAVASSPGGKFLVRTFACNSASCGTRIARFTAAGELDSSFGDAGILATSVPPGEGMVTQPDGAVVISAGPSAPSTQDFPEFVLHRYDSSGLVDASFGMLGQVRTPVAPRGTLGSSTSRLALLSDGGILAVGYNLVTRYKADPGCEALHCAYRYGASLALVRYRPDGSVDPAFGIGGTLAGPFESLAPTVLLLQTDGKFTVAGTNAKLETYGAPQFYPWFLVRFNGNGTVDGSFKSVGAICGDGVVAIENSEACDNDADNGRPGSCCTEDCHIRAAGEVCRSESMASACDIAEACDGVQPSCAEDRYAGTETLCALQDPCSIKDHCDTGQCVSGLRICGGTAVPRTGKRRKPRIDVTCNVDRQGLPGAQKGGSCTAEAFIRPAGSATPADATSSTCTTRTDDVAECGVRGGRRSEIAPSRSRKLRKNGMATVPLRLTKEAQMMLRRNRGLDVDVCARIRLRNDTDIPLRCSLALRP